MTSHTFLARIPEAGKLVFPGLASAAQASGLHLGQNSQKQKQELTNSFNCHYRVVFSMGRISLYPAGNFVLSAAHLVLSYVSTQLVEH